MSSATIDLSSIYAPGTSVGAYARSQWPQSSGPPSGAPEGAAVDTQLVAANGKVTFSNLVDDGTRYRVYGGGVVGPSFMARDVDPGSTSLAADQVWTGSNLHTQPVVQRSLGGTAIIAKAFGDGQSGVQYWKHDDTTGYLLHLLAGPNSGPSVSMIGIGTDEGSGGAMIMSLKNAGKGLQIYDNPSHSDWGFYMAAYNKTADPFRVEQFVGSPGAVFATMDNEGFFTGVATTQGSTTVTVPGGNLTGADIGRGVKQLTSRGEANPFPAGATIASVTDSTHFVMSAAATATVTDTNLQIAGRPSPAAQPILRLNQNANNWMKFSPTTSEIRSLLNVIGGLGTLGTSGVNDIFIKASTGEIRGYANTSGSTFRRSDIQFTSTQGVLLSYAPAGRGSESGPVTGFAWNSTGIGFNGAAPSAKAAISGSRGGNAALAALLTELAAKGLITDSTTA